MTAENDKKRGNESPKPANGVVLPRSGFTVEPSAGVNSGAVNTVRHATAKTEPLTPAKAGSPASRGLLSSARQRQRIGYLRKLLNIEDDLYYEILRSDFDARTSKDLTVKEAYELITRFTNDCKERGIYKQKATVKMAQYKYNNLKRDKSMASPAQLRMIEAMWADVSRADTDEGRALALKAFIKRITARDGIRFLTSKDAAQLIAALNKMRGGKNEQ